MRRDYTGRADPDQPTTDVVNRPANPLRATDPAFFETRWEYNADSQVTRRTDPNGTVTEYVYECDVTPSPPPKASEAGR